MASGVIAFIRFDRARQVAIHFIVQRGITQLPAPAGALG